MDKTPKEEREFHIHYARVMLNEFRSRRLGGANPGSWSHLLEWAANGRRRAAAIDVTPAQSDLFGGM